MTNKEIDKHLLMIKKYILARYYNYDVEELFSSCCLTYAECLKSFKGGCFEQFMMERVKWNILNHSRVVAKDRRVVDELEKNNEFLDICKDENYSYLHLAIDKLPTKDKELINQRFFEDKTFAELAKIYNCSKPTIHNRLSKVIKKIKEKI